MSVSLKLSPQTRHNPTLPSAASSHSLIALAMSAGKSIGTQSSFIGSSCKIFWGLEIIEEFDGGNAPNARCAVVQAIVVHDGSVHKVQDRAHDSVLLTVIVANDLPTSTGQPLDFLSVLPGVSDVSTRAAFASDRNGPTFNVSGSRSSDNLLLLDGLMHTNF